MLPNDVEDDGDSQEGESESEPSSEGEDEQPERGAAVVVTDLDDSDLEDRASQLFGEEYSVVHKQIIANTTQNGLQPAFELQSSVQYAGWPGSDTPPDSSISTYTIDDEEVGLSSLQHKRLDVEDENGDTHKVEVASIFKFDDFEYKSSLTEEDLSSCHLIVRHYDDEEKKAVVEYKTLSSLFGGTVDSNICALHLSSIQNETWTDPDTGEDIEYHQLYNF